MTLRHPKRSARDLPRLGSLHIILHSLCTFLQANNKLRSFQLDLHRLTERFIAMGAFQHLLDGIGTAVNPLRLLSNDTIVHMNGVQADLLIPTAQSLQLAHKLAAGTTWASVMQLQAAGTAYMTFGVHPYEEYLFGSQIFSAIMALIQLTLVPFGRKTRTEIAFLLANVRQWWDQVDPAGLDEGLLKRVPIEEIRASSSLEPAERAPGFAECTKHRRLGAEYGFPFSNRAIRDLCRPHR